MHQYSDIYGDSNIVGYQVDETSLTVWFKDVVTPYIYSYMSAGAEHIEVMKILAASGRGLNDYINNNVRFKYVRQAKDTADYLIFFNKHFT
ncbi:hypothetical protein [Thalassotalea atypica]|uniref:hypothetical protein n=1 Tax=Thalassotalea atypica TaxID=2054316 RepID=UPI002572C629|nr:hypothetical protein [Thalassotalea atypica]